MSHPVIRHGLKELKLDRQYVRRSAYPTIWDSGLLKNEGDLSKRLHLQTLWDWWISLCRSERNFPPWFPVDPQHRELLLNIDVRSMLIMIDRRPGLESFTAVQAGSPYVIEFDEGTLNRLATIRAMKPGESVTCPLSDVKPETREEIFGVLCRTWPHKVGRSTFRCYSQSYDGQPRPIVIPEGVSFWTDTLSRYFCRAIRVFSERIELHLCWNDTYKNTDHGRPTFALYIPTSSASESTTTLLYVANEDSYADLVNKDKYPDLAYQVLTGPFVPESPAGKVPTAMIQAHFLGELYQWLDLLLRDTFRTRGWQKSECICQVRLRYNFEYLEGLLAFHFSHIVRSDPFPAAPHLITVTDRHSWKEDEVDRSELVIVLSHESWPAWNLQEEKERERYLSIFGRLDAIIICYDGAPWPFPEDFCQRFDLSGISPSVILSRAIHHRIPDGKYSALHFAKSLSMLKFPTVTWDGIGQHVARNGTKILCVSARSRQNFLFGRVVHHLLLSEESSRQYSQFLGVGLPTEWTSLPGPDGRCSTMNEIVRLFADVTTTRRSSRYIDYATFEKWFDSDSRGTICLLNSPDRAQLKSLKRILKRFPDSIATCIIYGYSEPSPIPIGTFLQQFPNNYAFTDIPIRFQHFVPHLGPYPLWTMEPHRHGVHNNPSSSFFFISSNDSCIRQIGDL